MKNALLYYSVGALLYCPANNDSIAASIIHEKFGNHYSLALCLEDTINDNCVAEAETILIQSIQTIYGAMETMSFYLPKIFIRIRCPEQINRLLKRLGTADGLITGFIVPKFSLDNADSYINAVAEANLTSSHTIYMMPIFESPDIIHLQNRHPILYSLKEKLDSVEDLVLNIRVGGNDLCHMFGFRRHSNESIHSIRPISNIFSDIITAYGMDYVVSGPVWEYYDGENWDAGLLQELNEDKLCGFIGKTVIHPKQIELVHSAYQVTKKDVEDAKSILNWNPSNPSFVSGSLSKERMNEYKTHSNWAYRILMLAEAYGIQR